jgi:hypothetical protein
MNVAGKGLKIELFGINWNLNKSNLKGIVPTPGDCDFPPYFSKVKNFVELLIL